jgi:hypothetical protein
MLQDVGGGGEEVRRRRQGSDYSVDKQDDRDAFFQTVADKIAMHCVSAGMHSV